MEICDMCHAIQCFWCGYCIGHSKEPSDVPYTLKTDSGAEPVCENCFDQLVTSLSDAVVSDKCIDIRTLRVRYHPHADLPVFFTVDNGVSSKPGSVHCQNRNRLMSVNRKDKHMLVKVAPMGETVTEVNVEVGSTVEQILDTAGVDDNGRAITVNNTPASLDTQVTAENSVISLANKMKGGC